MTVKQLKQALAALGTAADDMEFRVWLPGSEIYLITADDRPPTPFFSKGMVFIEGNLTPDSVLAS